VRWTLSQLSAEQCFRKCTSRLSQSGKLELFPLVESCLTCADSYYKPRSGNLRISLPALCSDGCSLDFQALEVPAGLELLIFIASKQLSCWCCLCVRIDVAARHVATACHRSLGLVRSMLPQSVFCSSAVVQSCNATTCASSSALLHSNFAEVCLVCEMVPVGQAAACCPSSNTRSNTHGRFHVTFRDSSPGQHPLH
jgi:hypothetical protein